jgi:hypothetical protein
VNPIFKARAEATMDILERAAKLRQEAELVMQAVRLEELLRPYGGMTPTGSYFLDLMVYPDIDLYMPKVSIRQLLEIGGRLAECSIVNQVLFEKSDLPSLPGGLYLKPRIDYGDWGRPWKIDIWSLEAELIAEKMGPMRQFVAGLTPALREQILRYKTSLLNDEHRTPRFSGYFIYKAFIDEGLSDFGQVTQYLIDNGIELEPSHRH